MATKSGENASSAPAEQGSSHISAQVTYSSLVKCLIQEGQNLGTFGLRTTIGRNGRAIRQIRKQQIEASGPGTLELKKGRR